MNLIIAAAASFIAWFAIVPVIFWLLRILGVYAIVEERTCNVYVLFGKVVAVLDEPGLHILLFKLGLKAPIVRWLADRPAISPQPAGQLRRRRAHGDRHLV
jgi:hypothetical protein